MHPCGARATSGGGGGILDRGAPGAPKGLGVTASQAAREGDPGVRAAGLSTQAGLERLWKPGGFHLSQVGGRVTEQEKDRGKRCWRCGEEEEVCHLPGGQGRGGGGRGGVGSYQEGRKELFTGRAASLCSGGLRSGEG